MTALEDKLSGWTGPSSATEQEKQDRTEQMIREAINAHEPFANMSRLEYLAAHHDPWDRKPMAVMPLANPDPDTAKLARGLLRLVETHGAPPPCRHR